MSRREIRLHELVGRTVRDAEGRSIGRIQDLRVEIELNEHGNEYVVRAFRVGRFGLFEWLSGSRFAWQALRFMGQLSFTIPWELMDLGDPARPRVSRSLRELSTEP
jgi:sporulation protein YlmC with PRC-barrel domain